ncbi:DUF1428 domain-containing protein [soil metagenome]
MAYIDGLVLAVPTANKQKYLQHAKKMDALFLDLGALRVLECWGDDVPEGKQTDFRRAVLAKSDETVVLAWIEWPDKATRDVGMEKFMGDPQTNPKIHPMPFDGMRMIFAGFQPILELGATLDVDTLPTHTPSKKGDHRGAGAGAKH